MIIRQVAAPCIVAQSLCIYMPQAYWKVWSVPQISQGSNTMDSDMLSTIILIFVISRVQLQIVHIVSAAYDT